MDLTAPLLRLIARELFDEAQKHELGEYASDAFIDAADALSDVIDLMDDINGIV